MKRLYLIFVWGLYSFCGSLQSAEKERIKDFTLYNGGWSEPLQRYNLALVRAALEVTQAKWGPYTLNLYSTHLSHKRSDIELGKAEKFNVRLDSYIVEDTHVYNYRSAVLSTRLNIMGLRALIVKESSAEQYRVVETRDDFAKLKPGQGFDWPDVSIYETHGINVIKAPSFDSIVAMLERGRFDYFPLSFIEAQQALNAYQQEGHALSIVDEIYIFYPMPFYIAYPKDKPEVFERIHDGIEILHSSGELKKLNEAQLKYMHAKYNRKARVYVLKNPLLSEELGNKITHSAMQEYFPNNKNIEYLPEQVAVTK